MPKSNKQNLTYLWVNDEFQHVYEYADSDQDGEIVYQANIQINKKAFKKFFPTAREAAKHVDIILLQNGKDPVNVLKRK